MSYTASATHCLHMATTLQQIFRRAVPLWPIRMNSRRQPIAQGRQALTLVAALPWSRA